MTRTTFPAALPLVAGFSLLAAFTSGAASSETPRLKRHVVDAISDTDYHHRFEPLAIEHRTRVLIDRHHPTIYAAEGDEHGAHAMLDILRRDGFRIDYLEASATGSTLEGFDLLILHGIPAEKVELAGGGTYWSSSLTSDEVDAIVRFVDSGGGLFLTQSHFPNAGGALLDAMAVSLRDGYVFHPDFPSFTDPEQGTCSHFFGLSRSGGALRGAHPLLRSAVGWGLEIETIDFLCGAAVFRESDDAILRFPPNTRVWDEDDVTREQSDAYAGLLGFTFGKGRVVIATDQGLFRNFIFTFQVEGTEETQDVYVTMTSPDNDNADLFLALIRWLSPRVPDPASPDHAEDEDGLAADRGP